MNLKPCPCGKTPNSLLIVDGDSAKWAYVYGDCCNEWHVEFRTMYNPINTEKCMKLAVEAWNIASRCAAEQSVRLTALWHTLVVSVFLNLFLLAVLSYIIGGR